MINPQSHIAHYFCHLHEYTYPWYTKLQNTNYCRPIYACTYIVKSAKYTVVDLRLEVVGDLKSEVGKRISRGIPSI